MQYSKIMSKIFLLILLMGGGFASSGLAAVTVTDLGTGIQSGLTVGHLTSVTLTAGSTLIVTLGYNTGPSTQVTWGVYQLTKVSEAINATNPIAEIWVLPNVVGGTDDIWPTYTVGPNRSNISAIEVTGLTTDPFDVQASNTGSSTTPGTTSTGTTTQANELLVAAFVWGNNAAEGGTWSTAFTDINGVSSTGGSAAANVTILTAYREVSAIGTYSADRTGDGSDDWGATIATFKLAGAGGGVNINKLGAVKIGSGKFQ
jgi:hypothetical protein